MIPSVVHVAPLFADEPGVESTHGASGSLVFLIAVNQNGFNIMLVADFEAEEKVDFGIPFASFASSDAVSDVATVVPIAFV